MDLFTQFEALENRTSAGLAQVKAAASESREELEQRIDQAQVDVDLGKPGAEPGSGEAAGKGQSARLRGGARESSHLEPLGQGTSA